MASFIIKSPDGKKYKVNAPDGTTPEQAMSYFKQNYSSFQQKYENPAEQQMISDIQAGQAVPKERIRENLGDLARTTLPIVGDIALSAAAPQLKLVTKAPLLKNLGIRGVNALMRGAGAAAGSGAGSVGSDLITGQGVDIGRAGKESAVGGVGDVAMSAVGGVGKLGLKAVKPLFKIIPDITFSGSAVKNFYNNQFKKNATERAEKFLIDIAPDSIKKQSDKGKSLSVLVNNAYSQNSGVYDLYKNAIKESAEKEGGTILVDDTAQMIGDLFEMAKGKSGTNTEASIRNIALGDFGFSPNVKKALSELQYSDSISPEKIQFLLAEVFKNKGWNKLNPSQKSLREQLKDSLMADIDKLSIGNAGELKKAADKEYKALAKFNSIRRIYNKALATADQATGEKVLQPAKLYEEIYANQKRILSDPELSKIWPNLESEALSALDSAQKIKKSSPTGSGSVLNRGAGMVAGGFLFGPAAGVPAAESLGAVSAWALMTPSEKSILKKLFKASTPVFKTGTKAGIHMAGQEVNFDQAE